MFATLECAMISGSTPKYLSRSHSNRQSTPPERVRSRTIDLIAEFHIEHLKRQLSPIISLLASNVCKREGRSHDLRGPACEDSTTRSPLGISFSQRSPGVVQAEKNVKEFVNVPARLSSHHDPIARIFQTTR